MEFLYQCNPQGIPHVPKYLPMHENIGFTGKFGCQKTLYHIIAKYHMAKNLMSHFCLFIWQKTLYHIESVDIKIDIRFFAK